MAIDGAKFHGCDPVEQFDQTLIALYHRTTELIAVDIKVVKKTNEPFFKLTALRGFFDMRKYFFQCLVQISIFGRIGADIFKKFAGQDKKSFFLHQPFTGFFCFLIGETGIIEVRVSGFKLTFVNIVGQVLRNIAIEHRS